MILLGGDIFGKVMLKHSQGNEEIYKSHLSPFHPPDSLCHLCNLTKSPLFEIQRVNEYLFPYFRYNQCGHEACPECYIWIKKSVSLTVLHRSLEKGKRNMSHIKVKYLMALKCFPPRLWSGSKILNLEVLIRLLEV